MSLIGIRDPVEHKRRRKTWDRGLNAAAIKNYNEIIVKRVRELVEHFGERAGQEIDLSKWMGHFS
jgi:cytochrome P450